MTQSRKEILFKKFPDEAEAALAIEDPSEGKNKYLLWIAKQLKQGHDPADISASLQFFHSNPDRFKEKDIHKYKDLKTLEDLIKDMGLSKRKEKEKDKKGGEKIFENEDFLVVRVDDKPAMILYGAETKWCTTMKDHSYYEDYVNNGNDFYILISKKEGSFTSSKYAIVRKSFLEFQVYDANDTHAREFTESEQDKLRIVLQAIVIDKPPKNYLREVCQGRIPAQEAADWLTRQSDVTRTFVEGKRPDLQFLTKTIDELITIFSNSWQRRHMDKMEYAKIVEIAKALSEKKGMFDLKSDVLDLLKNEDKLVMSQDKDARLRARVATQVSPEKAKDFFGDRAISVLKSAARKVEAEYLFRFAGETQSVRKRRAINEIIIERVSQEKIRQFVLNQSKEVLLTLMD
jgi:hypothetical protein